MQQELARLQQELARLQQELELDYILGMLLDIYLDSQVLFYIMF
jgi:hypothetical protein